MSTATAPQVGMGATSHYPQDSYPFLIVKVSESGKTAWVVPVEPVDITTGHKPARYDGPYPVWSHEYTAEELQSMKRDVEPQQIRLTNRGWGRKGTPFTVGSARYHRNHSY